VARNLSATATASINAQSTDEVWLTLLTIDSPELEIPLRFVNNNESVTSRGDVYLAFPFDIEFPGQDEENPGEARLVIDNIDRSIVNFIRTIFTPPVVSIEVVLASSPDTVEAGFYNMTLRNVSYDAKAVSGLLKFEDIVIEPVTFAMTPERFPGQFSILWLAIALSHLIAMAAGSMSA
jgi:hypothetical protein